MKKFLIDQVFYEFFFKLLNFIETCPPWFTLAFDVEEDQLHRSDVKIMLKRQEIYFWLK